MSLGSADRAPTEGQHRLLLHYQMQHTREHVVLVEARPLTTCECAAPASRNAFMKATCGSNSAGAISSRASDFRSLRNLVACQAAKGEAEFYRPLRGSVLPGTDGACSTLPIIRLPFSIMRVI
jgi:hypothetical protein